MGMKSLVGSLILLSGMLHYVEAQQRVENDTTDVKLSEVEVSASRTATSYGKTGRVISVIDRKQLDRMNVQSVTDVLDYLTGVDIRQRGPEGIQADVSIRGGSFDQVLVLLNGVNVTDPQTGHFSLNLPVDLASVDRIEVLEGPGARSFGPNAYSGAINFITGTQNDSHIKAQLQGGSFGFGKGAVTANVATGNYKSFATVNYSRSDGHHENTDFKQTGAFYQGAFDFGSEKLEFQMGYLDKSFGAFAFYTPKYPNQYEQNRTITSSIKFTSIGQRIKVTPVVYWRRNHDRFELYRSNPASWYTGHNYHMTDVFGASLNGNIKWSAGTTAVGGEVRGESIWSTTIGDALLRPLDVPGEDGKQFTKGYSRQNASMFLEHSFSVNRFTVTGGVVAASNSGLDYQIHLFPGIDMSYQFLPNAKVYAGVNSSLRMPTFTDLLYVSPSADGNILLKPEKVTAYEAGVKMFGGPVRATIGVFVNDATDVIDWVRASTTEKFKATNIPSLTSTGVQVGVGYYPIGNGFLGNSLRSVTIDYLSLHQDRDLLEGYDSRYVMDYLKHKVVVRLEHGIVGPLTASWGYNYQDRTGTYLNATDERLAYKPVHLVDIQLNYTRSNYKLFAGATNLFDTSYEDIGNVPQPGRWIRGGMVLMVGM